MSRPDDDVSKVGDRRQYLNPPILEALCEIRFAEGSDWDPTLPGLIYSRLRDQYPAKPAIQGILQAGFNPPEVTVDEAATSIVVRADTARVQFRSDDSHRMVAVGEGVVSAHLFRPYTSWDEFKPQIRTALEIYRDVANPKGAIRIGLRYINQVSIPAGDRGVDLEEYFTSPPDPPEGLPQTLRAFITRQEGMYEDAPVRLVTTFASAGTADGGNSLFTLDLDVIREWDLSEAVEDLDDLMAIIEDLRIRERRAFESLITDRSRELFDAD